MELSVMQPCFLPKIKAWNILSVKKTDADINAVCGQLLYNKKAFKTFGNNFAGNLSIINVSMLDSFEKAKLTPDYYGLNK